MRVYDLKDKVGRTFAFEVRNFFLDRQGCIRVISSIPGARIVWRPSLTWFSPDVFVKFELDGVTFEAWEPYGDSDSYWIGPESVRFVAQLENVREAFLRANRYPF